MYTRITLYVSGENFDKERCLKLLFTHCLKVDLYSNSSDQLSLIHPNEFSQEYWDEEYELVYSDFIKNNINQIIESGGINLNIFVEVYLKLGEQCNFEILSSEFINLIKIFNVSIPVSVYTVE